MVLRYRGTRVACNGVAIKEGWCGRAMAGLLVARVCVRGGARFFGWRRTRPNRFHNAPFSTTQEFREFWCRDGLLAKGSPWKPARPV